MLEGQTVEGIRIVVTEPNNYLPVESGVQILYAFYRHALARNQNNFFPRVEWLNKMSGTRRLYQMMTNGTSASRIIEAWQQETAAFDRVRAKYLLY